MSAASWRVLRQRQRHSLPTWAYVQAHCHSASRHRQLWLHRQGHDHTLIVLAHVQAQCYKAHCHRPTATCLHSGGAATNACRRPPVCCAAPYLRNRRHCTLCGGSSGMCIGASAAATSARTVPFHSPQKFCDHSVHLRRRQQRREACRGRGGLGRALGRRGTWLEGHREWRGAPWRGGPRRRRGATE